MSGLSIAKSLEFLLIRPGVTRDDVTMGCQLASNLHLASVVVHPVHAQTAAAVLRTTDTRLCVAISAPFGYESIPAKLVAMEQAQVDGVDEMIVVLDHSAVIEGNCELLWSEVDRIHSSAFWTSLTNTRGQATLTLAFESTMVDVSRLSPFLQKLEDSSVDFVQTSAGSQSHAVTEDHIYSWRGLLPETIAIKAVGGVSSLDDARNLLVAGAVRVGSGAAIAIAQEELDITAQRKVNG